MIEAERGLGLVLRGAQPLELGLGGAGLDDLGHVAAVALKALADALGLEVRPDEDAVRAPDLEAENVGSSSDAPAKDVLGVRGDDNLPPVRELLAHDGVRVLREADLRVVDRLVAEGVSHHRAEDEGARRENERTQENERSQESERTRDCLTLVEVQRPHRALVAISGLLGLLTLTRKGHERARTKDG